MKPTRSEYFFNFSSTLDFLVNYYSITLSTRNKANFVNFLCFALIMDLASPKNQSFYDLESNKWGDKIDSYV